jgi:arylsulfatase A-like enzyme
MKKLPLLFVYTVAAALLVPSPYTVGGQNRPPNIVLVMSDDQGYGDLGIHGNDKVQTPHLDRFAQRGIRLNRFYVSPVCSPTRASLLTGRYHYRTGVIHTSRGGALMHGDEVTVAELLRSAGYRTGIFGKWHLGDNFPMRPQDQGFEQSLVHRSGGIGQAPDVPNSYTDSRLVQNGADVPTKGYCTDVFFSAALDFIGAGSREPFFAYIATNVPHTPLEVDDAWVQPFRDRGLDNTTARIYAMLKNLDENFGRLLARLEELNLRDHTLVIFMTDNGAQQERFNAGLRGRKSWVYEGGIRVPFFIQWPAQFRGGREIDRIAAHIDVLPTLLDIAGVQPPAHVKLDGVSLLPLLSGNSSATAWPDRTLFLQCHRGLTPKLFQNAAAVTQRYKLVASPGTFNREDLLPSTAQPVLELYDLESDPAEQQDLAGGNPATVEVMRNEYASWFADVWQSRRFTPGIIHLGNEAENPVRLCRYQDASWKFNQPHGWLVKVERGGRYEIALGSQHVSGAGRISVSWQGRELSQPIRGGETRAHFDLAAGQGTIEVDFAADDAGIDAALGKRTAGDVTVRFLSPAPSVPSRGAQDKGGVKQ